MKWTCLIALFLVSCGSDPVSQPFLAKPIQPTPKKKKEVVEPKVEPVAVTVSELKEKASSSEKKDLEKIFAGKVTFHGLSDLELAAFRVIPEAGQKLIVPKNITYQQVDGLWWKGAKTGTWFKIPGSSHAWVGKGAPEEFEGVVKHGDLTIRYKSRALVKVVGWMKKTVLHPSWVRSEGKTFSPVPSPWSKT